MSSWAVIDSELQPKAAYWYARRFFAPLLLSFKPVDKFVEVWATNDTLSTWQAEFELEILSFSGEISFARHERVLVPANMSLRVAASALGEFLQINPRQQYARARLKENGGLIAENRYFFRRYKHLELENPRIDCHLEKIGARDWQVKVKTDRFVKNLALLIPPSAATLTENYFDLDANSERSIEIRNLSEKQSLKAPDLHWK